MSENSKEKKPHGWFFKNFIVGIIFSSVVWALLLIFCFNKDASTVINLLIAIIPGVIGAMGYVLVKLWQDWLYSHFVFFTRINPLMILTFRYIIYPALGCILFPFALLLGVYFLYLKIKGEL